MDFPKEGMSILTMTTLVRKRVEEVLLRHLKFADVNNELLLGTELAGLGLDSMSAINLLLEIEKEFDITFSDELLSMDTLQTVSTLLDAVEKSISLR